MKNIIILIFIMLGIIFLVVGIKYTINRICLKRNAKKRIRAFKLDKNMKNVENHTLEKSMVPSLEKITAETLENKNVEEKIKNMEQLDDEESNENQINEEEKLQNLAEEALIKNTNRQIKVDNRTKNSNRECKKVQTKREPEYPGHRASRAKKKEYALNILKYYHVNYTYLAESSKVVFVENKFKLNLETLEFMNLKTRYKEKGIKRLLYRLDVPGIEKSRGVRKNAK